MRDALSRRCVEAAWARDSAYSDVSLACATARRFSGPAYSSSYFHAACADGLGMEVIELCLPV